jgi:hypothetical protein
MISIAPRGGRVVAAEFELAVDIGGELRGRITVRRQLFERLQPHLQRAAQDGEIDVLFAPKVIKEVRLGHAGERGDLVDRGAAEAEGREHFQRGVENPRLVLRLNARPFSGAMGAGEAGWRHVDSSSRYAIGVEDRRAPVQHLRPKKPLSGYWNLSNVPLTNWSGFCRLFS